MTATATPEDGFARLRAAFPPEAIGKLPRNGQGPPSNCNVCGGWHKSGGIHLDFIGHAAVTDRLLSVDPAWNWEPLSFDEHGQPLFVRNSNGAAVGLWIKLTVLGVTRLGYGSVESGKAEAAKELIGDALRNAAMRFGVGLDLWSKSELESQVEDRGAGSATRKDAGGGDRADTSAAAGPNEQQRAPQVTTGSPSNGASPLRDAQQRLAAVNARHLNHNTPDGTDVQRELWQSFKDLSDEQLLWVSPAWKDAGLPTPWKVPKALKAEQVDKARELLASALQHEPDDEADNERPFTDEEEAHAG